MVSGTPARSAACTACLAADDSGANGLSQTTGSPSDTACRTCGTCVSTGVEIATASTTPAPASRGRSSYTGVPGKSRPTSPRRSAERVTTPASSQPAAATISGAWKNRPPLPYPIKPIRTGRSRSTDHLHHPAAGTQATRPTDPGARCPVAPHRTAAEPERVSRRTTRRATTAKRRRRGDQPSGMRHVRIPGCHVESLLIEPCALDTGVVEHPAFLEHDLRRSHVGLVVHDRLSERTRTRPGMDKDHLMTVDLVDLRADLKGVWEPSQELWSQSRFVEELACSAVRAPVGS